MLLKFYQLTRRTATKHQIVIRRLLSGYTQFDALYLFMKWELEKRVPLYKQLNKI